MLCTLVRPVPEKRPESMSPELWRVLCAIRDLGGTVEVDDGASDELDIGEGE